MLLLVLAGCVGDRQRILPDEVGRASLGPFRPGGAGRDGMAATRPAPTEIPAPPRPVARPVPRDPGPAPEAPDRRQDDPLFAHYGRRFGLDLDGSENLELLKTVDEWMGAPYEWGGCSERGVDCSCLVQSIYAEVYGLNLNRTVRTLLRDRLKTVAPGELREGDLLFFDMKDQGDISHVGIYLKNGAFVHASSSRGVMLNRLKQPFYRNRLARAARPRRGADSIQLSRVALQDLVVVQR
jgi:lipoprotein Spr